MLVGLGMLLGVRGSHSSVLWWVMVGSKLQTAGNAPQELGGTGERPTVTRVESRKLGHDEGRSALAIAIEGRGTRLRDADAGGPTIRRVRGSLEPSFALKALHERRHGGLSDPLLDCKHAHPLSPFALKVGKHPPGDRRIAHPREAIGRAGELGGGANKVDRELAKRVLFGGHRASVADLHSTTM